MRRRLIRYKVYIDRGRGYVGYAQFIMTLLVMLKLFEDTSVGVWIFSVWWPIPVFIALFFAGMIIVGRIDMILIKPMEVSEINRANTELLDIQKTVKEIKKKLDDNSTDSVSSGQS